MTSANCFVRKDDFKKIGGFNTNLFPGEDPEFFARAKNKGYLIAYNPDLIVYHKRRATYKEFFKQFYKYGNTRLKKEQYVKSKNGFLFFLQALFTVYFIPLLLLGIILHKIFLMPLVIYGMFALIASVYESVRNNYLYGVILIPFLYMSMHIAYGCGILVSLIKNSKTV